MDDADLHLTEADLKVDPSGFDDLGQELQSLIESLVSNRGVRADLAAFHRASASTGAAASTAAARSSAAASTPAASTPAAAGQPAARAHGTIDDDEHLAAYNDYLARLNQSGHGPAGRQ